MPGAGTWWKEDGTRKRRLLLSCAPQTSALHICPHAELLRTQEASTKQKEFGASRVLTKLTTDVNDVFPPINVAANFIANAVNLYFWHNKENNIVENVCLLPSQLIT